MQNARLATTEEELSPGSLMKTSVCSTARIPMSQRTSLLEFLLTRSPLQNASLATQVAHQISCAIQESSTLVRELFVRPATRPAAEDVSAQESASSVTTATAFLAAI